ncbi:LAQU0S26e00474g1_1 [Lachancea quebecensis]|uniref:Glucosamine 6-phosphate N-acetyltransferase n=1 Tax=Lachancea quebecensis TaxID=1654605 RepID=A0A0P1KYJ8_9SACH|nr:LAQU0S26e00474g1_1 [Lachancea quebecensis]
MPVLPSGYSIRRVESSDYEGVVETLKVLTVVGDVTKEQFEETVAYWNEVTVKSKGESMKAYNPHVITDDSGKVVATGNVFIERKVLHDCGLVGHIEDIAVAKNQQGKKLGQLLIEHLSDLALSRGCYKVILDCDEKNVGFYQKCGYSIKGVEMDRRS